MLLRTPLKTAKILVVAICAAGSAASQTNLRPAMQFAADSAMAGHPGAAVVLDVASGKILAGNGMEVAARRVAAPGSAIKPFTLLALLSSNHFDAPGFDPRQRWFCPRTLQVAGKELNCSHPPVPSGFDAVEALAYSCNSYFANFASRMREQDLKTEFRRAGLMSSTGLARGEAVGRFEPAANADQLKLRALGEQGISVTPLEMVSAYRWLALRARQGLDSRQGDAAGKIVAQGLKESADYGMANSARSEGIAVAGKTGTAGSPTSALTHGWFAGYAPADDPEIVLVVYLEHGRGMDAAAVAHELFTAYQKARGGH